MRTKLRTIEDIREYNRNYYQTNKERLLVAAKEWAQKHPGYINDYMKKQNGKYYKPEKAKKYYLFKKEAARLMAIEF